ncbi:MAG: D-alanyl-D-alanine carboxypeptidase/D-alanyl-D-alanine-endopeptidase [Planctomycetales bacterium]|nr:D-alanyl-D-alanine carboxypeptidase/D-alanyl-D-alanine-endopeptidase [Planctomycetales bacterium]
MLFAHVIVCALPAKAEKLASQQLVAKLDDLLRTHEAARRSNLALKVVDLTDGSTVYDSSGDRLFTPASNLKIYTTACALGVWDPDRQFSTEVRALGPIVDGVLQGDITLVGGGDSMLTSARLSELAERVVADWGLKKIQGRVHVDRSRYGSPFKGPGWMWDDDPDYYNMSISSLMVDFNVLKVRVAPDEQGRPQAALAPVSAWPLLHLETRGDAEFSATRRPFTEPIAVLCGETVSEPKEVSLTMHDPYRWIAGLFAEQLRQKGVEASLLGPTEGGDGVTPPGGQPQGQRAVAFEGASIAETLKHFCHASENAVGEVLLHEIAIAQGVAQPKWSDGAKAITEWLTQTAGLEEGSFRLVDGSGLSRYNLISADSSTRLLVFMHSHPHAQTFYDALPKYDVARPDEGQVGSEKGDAETRPCVAAKPGGMSGVSTISGYLDTLDGRRLAFSFLANGYLGSNRPVLELRRQIWETLQQYAP